jgi:hypothetical protein
VFELPGHVIRNGQIARDAKASLARYPIELNRENALWLFVFIVFSPLETAAHLRSKRPKRLRAKAWAPVLVEAVNMTTT